MENIINSILEIDQMAKDKIKNAEHERNKIIAEARADKDKLISNKISEADVKLNELMTAEKAKTDVTLSKINKELIEETERLDAVYDNNSADWQDKIFNEIING